MNGSSRLVYDSLSTKRDSLAPKLNSHTNKERLDYAEWRIKYRKGLL